MTSFREALGESQTIAWLLEEVNKTTHLNKNDLIHLLGLINAPANLQALFLVFDDLPSILEKAKSIQLLDKELTPDIDFDKAINTYNLLIRLKPQLENCGVLSQLFQDRDSSTWRQLHGKLGSNPLYSCLCFRSIQPSLTETFHQLQAQLILASHIFIKSGHRLTILDDAFLSVRKLSERKCSDELGLLPANLLPASDYLKLVSEANSGSHIHIAGKILADAYSGRKNTTKLKGNDQQGKIDRIKSEIEVIDDYENNAAFWTGENFIPKGVLSKEESDEYARHGGTDEFSGGQDDVPVPLPNENTITTHTLEELSYQGKQRSNQEALENQLNPLGWNELNQFDIHILCKYLKDGWGQGTEDSDNALVRDCLNLMFWLSAPLERVLRLPKFNSQPAQDSPEGLYLKAGRVLVARLYTPGPDLKIHNFRQFSGSAYDVEKYCNIPLPSIAHSKSLLNACRTSPLVDMHYSPNPIGSNVEYNETVLRKITKALGELNREHGTRLSVGRISQYWLHALSRERLIDYPSAMLFFGHDERFSIARIHYTCASVERLENVYRKITSDMLSELGYDDGFPDQTAVNDQTYLGTPFCPLPETVRALVKSLRGAVEGTRSVKSHFRYVQAFHNNYAIYTACLIAYATTYRAVRDPSLYEKDINFASGIGVISDKDDEYNYHSRFVWISEVCQQQIIFYRRHLQRIHELFSQESPSLFKLFSQLDKDGRPLNLFLLNRTIDRTSVSKTEDHEEYHGNKHRFIYQLEELRPGTLEKRLKKHHNYRLPVNANRHYIKNELLERGCPSEVIEAQLGHWELGLEPWNRLSNLHPREFCRQLDMYLTPILERDGWKAIKGYEL